MARWLVTVGYRSPTGEEMSHEDPRLDVCRELLAEHLGEARVDFSPSGASTHYAVTVEVDATTMSVAIETAEALIEPAIERADLPNWPASHALLDRVSGKRRIG